MNFLVNKQHISEYIPQKPPIQMIDAIIKYEETRMVTQFEVLSNNIFVQNGLFCEPGITENMAQTAAAKAGYETKLKKGPPFIGFIGAIKNLKLFFLPKVGSIITTTVEVKTEVMGITLIEAFSECNNKKIAACEMKIVIQNTTHVSQ
ncbi:MAG: 3-hydroxyacyl-ACP dehydratase [Bacteroidetes bacterium]|nr:3-hydroxyacyl-ACP dehydratase [Bacteroidota bacterium]